MEIKQVFADLKLLAWCEPYSERRTPFPPERCFHRFRHLQCDEMSLSNPLGERDYVKVAKEMHRPLVCAGQKKKNQSKKER